MSTWMRLIAQALLRCLGFFLFVLPHSAGTKPVGQSPVLLNIALADASHLRSDNPSASSAEFQQIQESYSAAQQQASGDVIESLLAVEKLRHFKNDFIPDDLAAKYVNGGLTDLEADDVGTNSDAKALSVAVSDNLRPILSWYFSRENRLLDRLLLFNIRQNSANFPNLNASTVQAYFQNHPDQLLGQEFYSRLMKAPFTADSIRSIEDTCQGRLSSLPVGDLRSAQTQKPSENDLTELATWSRNIISIKTHLNEMIGAEQAILASIGLADSALGSVTSSSRLSDSEFSGLFANLPIIATVARRGASAERLATLLRAGAASNLSAMVKDNLKASLEARATVEKSQFDIVSDATNIVSIVKTLDGPHDAQIAANKALYAAKLLEALAKEDYVSAIASAISIFANPEPDQTQSMLSEVLKQLQEIKDLEKQMISLINDVSTKLDTALYRLDNISENLEAVKAVAREDVEYNKGFNNCQLINAPNPDYFDENGDFRSLAARKEHYSAFSSGTRKDYFLKCLGFLDAMFGNSTSRISVLFRQATETDKTFLQGRRYATALDLIRKWMPTFANLSPQDQDLRFDRLFTLSLDETKLNNLPSLVARIESEKPNYDRFLAKEKYDLLSVVAIKQYVNVLLRYYFYPALISEKNSSTVLLSPIEAEQLAQNVKSRKSLNTNLAVGKSQLQNALRIVNTAIAQNEILSSSITIIASDNAMSSYVVPGKFLYYSYGVDDPNYVNWINRRKDAAIQLRNDNASSLWLLGYDAAIMSNWIRFIMLVELHPEIWKESDPYKSTSWGAVPNSLPESIEAQREHLSPTIVTPDKMARMGFSNHYCDEWYSIPGWPGLPPKNIQVFASCIRFEGLLIIPHSMVAADSVSVPMPPDYTTKLTMQTPEVSDDGVNSPELTTPVYPSEMFVLLSLKSRILAALDGYSKFDDLNSTEKAAQVGLMIGAAKYAALKDPQITTLKTE
jgi:hypothetical protein